MHRIRVLYLMVGILLIYTPIRASNEFNYSFMVPNHQEQVIITYKQIAIAGGEWFSKSGEPEMDFRYAKFVLPPDTRILGITVAPDKIVLG